MILYPAIDLKDGQCVRLVRGEMADAAVFSDDPAAQAQSFAAAGFAWIHVVDLNGAFAGRPVNGEAVDAILDAVTIPVQLGGGIRDMATINDWLARGVARVILGTAALRDPDLVRNACREYPGRVAVGIDVVGDVVVAVVGDAVGLVLVLGDEVVGLLLRQPLHPVEPLDERQRLDAAVFLRVEQDLPLQCLHPLLVQHLVVRRLVVPVRFFGVNIGKLLCGFP